MKQKESLMAAEQHSPIDQAPQTQEQLQGDQAPASEDALTQGMRVFFQRLQSQQHEQEAARDQGRGR